MTRGFTPPPYHGSDGGADLLGNGYASRHAHPVYALNLFNVSKRDEYMAYSRRSAREVEAHGGKVVALGKFREAPLGEFKPRSVLILRPLLK